MRFSLIVYTFSGLKYLFSEYSFNLNGESFIKTHGSYRLLTYLFNIHDHVRSSFYFIDSFVTAAG